MSKRSPSGTSFPATGSIDFSTGVLSPVRAASSISSVAATRSRPSAGILSPASNVTMSPGTSSSASTSTRCPSRRAWAWMRSIFWSAATLSAALPSWFRPSTAFSTVMPMITRPVENSCRAMMLMSAAPRSTSCIRSRYWRRNACHPGSFSASASLFGPCSARRPSTSAASSPDNAVDPELGARLVRRHAVPGDLRVPYVDGGGAHSASTPVTGPIITGTAGACLAPTAAPLREAARSRRRTRPARAPSPLRVPDRESKPPRPAD